MWRHAVNGYMSVVGVGEGYLIMGPLRAGGELVELNWSITAGASVTCRIAAAISGSESPTLANLRSGTSLIQRSSDTAGPFGVPTVRMAPAGTEFVHFRLPLSVHLQTGGQYIVLGINSSTGDVEVYVFASALAIGPLRSGGNRKQLVDAGGLGVENGLDR